jgi:ribosomal protein S17E
MVSPSELHGLTLVDLRERYERNGMDAVDEFLQSGLTTVAEDVLSRHGMQLDTIPGITYNGLRRGVSYDPRSDEMVVRGPRDPIPGGYELLDGGRPSVLSVLASGLIAAYNQRLVDRHFETNVAATTHVHDRESKSLLPGIDAGFTQTYVFYIDADLLDAERRRSYVEARAAWYRDTGAANPRRYAAVARTIGARADAADGDVHAAMGAGLEIQDPLVAEGDRSVLDPP